MQYLGSQPINTVTRTRNLIPFPYKNSSGYIYKPGETYVQQGVSFYINSDGSIVAKGTNNSTKDPVWFRISYTINVPPGCTIGVSGCPIDKSISYVLFSARNADEIELNAYNTLAANNETKFTTLPETGEVVGGLIYIVVRSGATINNVLFKPMLYIGDTALPFEPYIQRYNMHTKVNLLDIDLGNKHIGANCSDFSISEDGKTIIATGNDSTAVAHAYSRGWVRLYNKNRIKLKKDDQVIVFADITLLEHKYGEASIVFKSDGEHCRATLPAKRYISDIPTRVSIIYRCIVSEHDKFMPIIAINSNRVKIENVEVYKLA